MCLERMDAVVTKAFYRNEIRGEQHYAVLLACRAVHCHRLSQRWTDENTPGALPTFNLVQRP